MENLDRLTIGTNLNKQIAWHEISGRKISDSELILLRHNYWEFWKAFEFLLHWALVQSSLKDTPQQLWGRFGGESRAIGGMATSSGIFWISHKILIQGLMGP